MIKTSNSAAEMRVPNDLWVIEITDDYKQLMGQARCMRPSSSLLGYIALYWAHKVYTGAYWGDWKNGKGLFRV